MKLPDVIAQLRAWPVWKYKHKVPRITIHLEEGSIGYGFTQEEALMFADFLESLERNRTESSCPT